MFEIIVFNNIKKNNCMIHDLALQKLRLRYSKTETEFVENRDLILIECYSRDLRDEERPQATRNWSNKIISCLHSLDRQTATGFLHFIILVPFHTKQGENQFNPL